LSMNDLHSVERPRAYPETKECPEYYEGRLR
jgi:hypothetical protein